MSRHELTYDDAVKIAKGCFDYGGGHSGRDHEIYHHGIQTVVTALEHARKPGGWDSQICALHRMGGEDDE